MKAQSAGAAFAALLLGCSVPLHAATTNATPARTISASGQFTVFAPNPMQSSAICAFAERVKHNWLTQLDLPDRWRDPIVIVVRLRQPDEMQARSILTELFQVEHILKYQVRCLVPPPLDSMSLGAAVVQALCGEYANREQRPKRGTAYGAAPVPLWLTEGLAQSILGRPDLLLASVQRSVTADRPPPAATIMDTATLPADPTDRDTFRANAWLLTDGLLRTQDGSAKLARFLSALGVTKSISNAFATVYAKDFPDAAANEKWWNMTRARRAAAVIAEDFTAAETSTRLTALLVTAEGNPAGKGLTTKELWRCYDQPWLGGVLRETLANLEALRQRAHPLYRPVIQQYAEAFDFLLAKKLSRYRRAVGQADRLRAATDLQVRRITEALDRAESRSQISEYLDQFDR